MKNIFKLLIVFIAAGALFVSCEKVPYFEANSHAIDPNASYYLQFVNASKTLNTGVTEDGDLVEIETTFAIALMGAPLSSDITVNFTVDPTTTIDESMYILSGNSFVIPAGKTSSSISLTTIAANMPVDESLKFVLNLEAGANGNPNPDGLKLDYNLKRIKFCPWSIDDMVGTYTGSELNAYGINITSGAKFEVFKVDDSHIAISGLFQSIYGPNYWGETVTAGDRVVFEYRGNGFLTTENQLICTTDDAWDYYMGPSGDDITWDGCNMSFAIPYAFHWDSGYSDYVPFRIDMVKDGAKRANTVTSSVEVTLEAPVK